jgi:hypothetical protein
MGSITVCYDHVSGLCNIILLELWLYAYMGDILAKPFLNNFDCDSSPATVGSLPLRKVDSLVTFSFSHWSHNQFPPPPPIFF